MSLNYSTSHLILLVAGIFVMIPSAQAQTEEDRILEVAQKVFDGINERNGDLVRSVMMPGSTLFATGMNDTIPFARLSTRDDFAINIESAEARFHERMFESEVMIRQGLAVVWAEYDFHINGEFSHCGIDTFTLVNTENGWMVASLAYTVEREGCQERSPITENSPK